ncbi:MAG: diacylglycerol kinase family lipid kinase [Bacteroidia bacterium]|nr:diacylglycerol kinase family lipid kinase [Bacteroidia bacterium]
METIFFFVLNPVAGGGKAQKKWFEIAKLLDKEEISYVVKLSEYSEHTSRLVHDAIIQGYRKIVAIGGDGTVNEAINGIFMQKNVPTHEILFGVIPLGTGNDWVKMYNIPREIHQAVKVLKKGLTRIQDIGKVSYQKNGEIQEHYYNNVAGMAYDGFVARQTLTMDKAGPFTKIFYLWLVVKLLWKYNASEFTFEADTFSYTGNVFCINVGICRYSGGGMKTVPEAVPDDGLFDITIIEAMPRLKLLWQIRRLYLGDLYGCKNILLKRAKSIRITSREPDKDLEADGEWLGYTPVSFEIIPRALQIISNS